MITHSGPSDCVFLIPHTNAAYYSAAQKKEAFLSRQKIKIILLIISEDLARLHEHDLFLICHPL